MKLTCYVPIETREDEILALRCLFSANGFEIVDIEFENTTAGFLGYPTSEEITPEIEELTNYSLKSIFKNRENTSFVIASMENERFHVIHLIDSKYVSEVLNSSDFQKYFYACMSNCTESLHNDLILLDNIWANTVNK